MKYLLFFFPPLFEWISSTKLLLEVAFTWATFSPVLLFSFSHQRHTLEKGGIRKVLGVKERKSQLNHLYYFFHFQLFHLFSTFVSFITPFQSKDISLFQSSLTRFLISFFHSSQCILSLPWFVMIAEVNEALYSIDTFVYHDLIQLRKIRKRR